MTLTHYDPEEAPDPQDWLSLDEQKQLQWVCDYHVAAHADLPDLRAHAVVHTVVEARIAQNSEPTASTVDRLRREGLSRHEAIHAVGSVVTGRGRIFWPLPDAEEQQRQWNAELEALSADGWRRRQS